MKKYFYLLLIYTIPLWGQNNAGILHERIYLQTDKQTYLAGELLWMKIFTVDINKHPLLFSKIVYVELLDEAASITRCKIDLSNGIGEGWLELPSDIPSGYYRLVAYTRFMRNENPDVFFEKNIGIINLLQANATRKKEADNTASSFEEKTANTFSLSTDNLSYNTRNQGYVALDGLPENIWTLSISVTGKDLMTIPGINPIQEWRKQLVESTENDFTGDFLPEYEGHIITGKVVDVNNEADIPSTPFVSFLSFPGKEICLFVGKPDSRNQVSFYTTCTSGIEEMVTAVFNASDKKYRVDIQNPYIQNHTQKSLPVLHLDSTHADQLLKRSVALQVLYSFTGDSLAKQKISDSYFKNKPTTSYPLDEYTRFTTMNEVITEFVTGVRFRRQRLEIVVSKGNYYDFGTPLVLLDGIPITNHQVIFNYNPLLVQRIDLYSGIHAFGGQTFDGIIAFSTYRYDYPDLKVDQTTQFVNYEGTQARRRFYIPDYSDDENRQSRFPDYRHTLLWSPNVQTQGKSSIQIPFNTSDFTGEFQVVVEGLTKDGNVVYAKSSFVVN